MSGEQYSKKWTDPNTNCIINILPENKLNIIDFKNFTDPKNVYYPPQQAIQNLHDFYSDLENRRPR